MTKVKVVRNKQKNIVSLTVEGHSGYGTSGNDIVCAAISAVSQTAIGAMQELIGGCEYVIEDGYMNCAIPANISDNKEKEASLILEVIVVGLKQIELSYKGYVLVLDEEV